MLDRTDPDQPTVQLLAGPTSDGTPFFEEVPVEPMGGQRYRILASPGLLDGLAAGDVFERDGDGTYRVLERSGNVCIQVLDAESPSHDRFDADLLPRIHAMGGWLDGRTSRVNVLTIPVRAGFATIERAMDAWVASTPSATWSYANVYAADGSQLGWWEELR